MINFYYTAFKKYQSGAWLKSRRNVPHQEEVNGMEFEKVKSVLVEQLGVDEDTITMDSSFVDDLGADSLDIVELIMGLETEFDIEIPNSAIRKFKTVKDVLSFIESEKK